MEPNPAVWVVESEEISIVGAFAPVASVRCAVTVTSFAPAFTSTDFGVKSKPESTGAAVSGVVFPAGMMRLLDALGGLVPMVLVAVTLNLYPVPLVRPVTVAVVWLAVTVLVMPPGVEVTV